MSMGFGRPTYQTPPATTAASTTSVSAVDAQLHDASCSGGATGGANAGTAGTRGVASNAGEPAGGIPGLGGDCGAYRGCPQVTPSSPPGPACSAMPLPLPPRRCAPAGVR